MNNLKSEIRNPKSAWLFPGQGAQTVGMGRDVFEQSAAARAVFEQADDVLGFALSRLCFEGPADELTQTENAQPALLTTSIALLEAAKERADLSPPVYMAGHSLGEYTALVAAGALQVPDALRLVRRRGELMAEAREGTMAAVIGLDLPTLEAVCAEAGDAGTVVIANQNAPGQLVISGAKEAVERAGMLAKERGAKRVLPIKVSAAFHSPLMQAAADGLQLAVAAVEYMATPAPPVIGNVTAIPLTNAGVLRAELVTQVTAPVRWIASIECMHGDGVTRFVEIGPGTVLTGLVKRIVPGAELVNVHDMASIEQWITTM